ncbi:MAG: methionyl-tRNA formyltransferase [Candidatus Ancillula sp.]|jgi:methionyl-tRNA formyltransferase|nr:methionyl-tRNA formyltransferase [Candidatus Ancillula sp.]
MRIVFAGTPSTAVEPLEKLNEVADIVAVFTKPDAPFGRKRVLTPSPVCVRAKELGLNVITPSNTQSSDTKSDILAELRRLKDIGLAPDVAFVVAYGEILDQEVLDALPLGWLNLHYSLLPKWRGAAPVQRAILNGDTTTGITIFKITKELDEGPILLQKKYKIDEEITTGELLVALSSLGGDLLVASLKLLNKFYTGESSEKIEGLYTEQSSTEGVEYAAKLQKEDARIYWNAPVEEIVHKINAFSPNPGAWFELVEADQHDEKITKVTRVTALKARLKSNTDLSTAQQSSEVELLEVKPAGRVAMSAKSWMHGLRGKWYIK